MTSFSAATVNAPVTLKHEALKSWVAEIANLTEPDSIYWADGSEAEYRALVQQLVGGGVGEDHHPGRRGDHDALADRFEHGRQLAALHVEGASGPCHLVSQALPGVPQAIGHPVDLSRQGLQLVARVRAESVIGVDGGDQLGLDAERLHPPEQGAASAVLLVVVLMIGVWVITRLSNLREDL